VVRGRLPTDPLCTAIILFDLEGEFFFGAAPDLDRYLEGLKSRAVEQGARVVVLRLKRTRNPDVVCLERIEHFLHEAQTLGIAVLLAGVRPDLLAAIRRLKFQDWYPADRIFPDEGDDADSATLKAVRRAYQLIGDDNTCEHCARNKAAGGSDVGLYYLV